MLVVRRRQGEGIAIGSRTIAMIDEIQSNGDVVVVVMEVRKIARIRVGESVEHSDALLRVDGVNVSHIRTVDIAVLAPPSIAISRMPDFSLSSHARYQEMRDARKEGDVPPIEKGG